MVEELIAEGYTFEQIREILASYGLSRSEAELVIGTALGQEGDETSEEIEEIVFVDEG